ncbi:MAG: PorP/SprF family type IX secretion system membrane protein [Crocinitomicaceae bacterium]|nr:PorP/SprF family type IX secretion system membrane protein [Crocinitomicaceae bacterium]MBK8924312.1 PorP/SprF family type IX secretion system membrane protein [Crocinitomicaceae bacterium]
MRKILSFFMCFSIVSISMAQQDAQYSHYMFDRMSFNPASTGFKGYCATVIYRNQWDRVQDAPNSTLLNLQANIPKISSGVGLSFTNDAIGFTRNNTVRLCYARHIPTSYGVFSAGASLGIVNVSFSPMWVPPTTTPDPNLPAATAGTGFDMNLGLYWHSTGDYPYYVGVSATHVLPASLNIGSSLGTTTSYSVARHYYIIAGYDYDLGATIGSPRPFMLRPSVLVKADGSTMIFDINVLAEYYLSTSAYLWGGASFRMSDGVPIMLGYAFAPNNQPTKNWLKFGYSFDIMTNPLKQYGKGTHELMINYCLFPPPPVVARHGNPFILQ